MEGPNDDAALAIRVCSYGYRGIVTQILVNWEPCYGVLSFTESVGIAKD